MAMTKDDIIRMAREAGIPETATEGVFIANSDDLGRLIAAEREACAKVCDAECNPTPNEGHITTYQSGCYITAEYLASAIRTRGNNGL
jgi:hypothetical protein